MPYPYIERNIDCLCGKQNCLEAILNQERILDYTWEKYGQKADSLSSITDEKIKKGIAIKYILEPLVYASTIVCNIFDPKRIIIEGSVLKPFYCYLKDEFEQKLRRSAWLKGPAEIRWYMDSDMDAPYGAVLHSGEKIINDFIDQIDLDH